MHGFYCAFPEGRYLPGGAARAGERGGAFGRVPHCAGTRAVGCSCPEYVDSEKAKLAERIRAARDDREAYAMQRLISLMCQYEDMGAAVLDDEDEAESSTTAA